MKPDRIYTIVNNFDMDEFNQNDLINIVKPVIEINRIGNFIVRYDYENLLTNVEKKKITDYFTIKFKCKIYIFDDGWDSPTFSTVVLFVDDTYLNGVIKYLFSHKINLFVIQDEWVSFKNYISNIENGVINFTPKYIFSFTYNYTTYDGIRISLVGDKEIYGDDVCFCEKFLNIRLIKKIVSETLI